MLNLLRHRELISSFVRRELVGKYRGSLLGMMWSFLNPLLLLGIYTFVFSVLLKVRFSHSTSPVMYGLNLFCGLIPWLAFAEAVGMAPRLILGNINLVKKTVFPLEILVVSSVLTGWVHSLFSIGILIAGVLIVEHSISFSILPLLLLVMIPQLLLTIGISWFLASVGVFIRDTGEIVSLALRLGMYLTPIVYPATVIPERFRHFLFLNPLAVIVESYRDVIIRGQIPDMMFLLIVSLIGGCFAILGYLWFMKSKRVFADVI
ncbi:MAG: hypothetical protein A2W23_10160 [Planctomycetes bacterium RBG_16_43_13]|nr:MAG: hypothetical protein A2W23_10160 [Planctomycetes bacterium RBG_16_43_13]